MEFIRKDELKEMLHNPIEYWKNKDDCTLITLLGVVDDVNKLPTIDSETVIYPSRPKGKWMWTSTFPIRVQCSNCGFNYESCVDYKYCPNCGAEMEHEE